LSARARHPSIPSAARRGFLRHAAGAAVGALAAPVLAASTADWPQKSIKLVVPYAAGGSADTLGRAIAKHLAEALKQPVVVENKGGAGGIIGSQQVAASAPDGYTLVVSGIGSHVIAPATGATFNPMKDFSHIALLGGPPIALVVNGTRPWRTFDEFVTQARAPGEGISWASPGRGTHGHLTGELLRSALKLNMVHVAYKGAGPAVADLLANQVAAGCMTLSSANAHFASGKLRLLALTAPARLPEYPDAPTFAELGYPNLTGTTWFSLSGPAGMPADIVERLNAEVRRGLKSPAIRAQLQQESMVSADYDPAAFRRFVETEIERWSPPARAVLAEKK
jgi:tripartite-type tricarboxylate transporter receptor subunit TctC